MKLCCLRSVLGTLCVALLALVYFTGCDFESASGDGEYYNDKFSFLSFSGTYRSGTDQHGIVFAFQGASGGGGSTTTTTGGGGGVTTGTQTEEEDCTTLGGATQNAGNFAQVTSTFCGQIDPSKVPGNNNARVVAGTLTASWSNGVSAGYANDDGSGGFNGVYTIANSSWPVTGTIDYDTGSFCLNIGNGGVIAFAAAVNITYQYEACSSGGSAVVGGDDTDDDGMPDDWEQTWLTCAGRDPHLSGDGDKGEFGDPDDDGVMNLLEYQEGTNPCDRDPFEEDIAHLTVNQTGNLLEIVTSEGHVLTGRISLMSVPGGDANGNTEGDVVYSFEVEGDGVRIVGTLSGVYSFEDTAGTSGGTSTREVNFSGRTITGTWFDSSGTADVLGYANEVIFEQTVGATGGV